MCMILDSFFFFNGHYFIFSYAETRQRNTSCFNAICYFKHTLANKAEIHSIFLEHLRGLIRKFSEFYNAFYNLCRTSLLKFLKME